MKVGLISDTHGDLVSFKIAVENILKDVDVVLHAGDILYHGPRNRLTKGYAPNELAKELNNFPVDILFSRGNCDSRVDQMLIDMPILSEYLFVSIEGFKILMYHGDKKINFKNSDIVVTGHTHIYNVDFFESKLFINPGSLSLPKNNPNGTCGVLDLSSNIINIFDILSGNVLLETKF
jgi:putative phosphoesterase